MLHFSGQQSLFWIVTAKIDPTLDQRAERGHAIAPMLGAFAEMSSHVFAIADLAISLLAAKHCFFFIRSHAEAK